MCLMEKSFRLIKDKKAGYAWKLVRRWDKKSFVPLYRHFSADGMGGQSSSEFALPLQEIFYRLFETTVVKPRIFTKTYDNLNGSIFLPGKNSYPAGIHLWKKFNKAQEKGTPSHELLKCHYNQALCEDDNAIVTLQITPVEEWRWDWDTCSFERYK